MASALSFRLGRLAALVLALGSAAAGADQVGPSCDDVTFLRRATLDLVGRQPSAAELEAFLASAGPSKRAEAVDRLLADPAWARTWGRYFRDVILYRRSDDRAAAMAGPLEAFFTGHLGEPVARWDRIAREMITARGRPTEHGETAIIMAQMGETADIAAEVARVFTGVQIQCAQCHDHFTDRWKRHQFHQFAAFFPRVEISRRAGQGLDRFEVVSRDVAARRGGKMPDNPRRGRLEHEMPDLDDPSQPGTPMKPRFFLTGHSLPLGTSDKERRRTAARLITAAENPWFARAIVNRIWTELVGEGFYDGIDDIGPDREARAADRLDALGRGFVAAGHDLKWLFREVMGTPAYQSPVRSRSDPTRMVGETSCPQRLRADQLFTQVLTALGLDEQGGRGGRRTQLESPRGAFEQVFGYDPGLPRDEIVGSIPQALLLMNSQPLARAIDGDSRGTLLGRLVREHADDRALADELHVRTLARHATPAEIAVCLDHVRETSDRAEAFEDIFWALVNSAEFIHRK